MAGQNYNINTKLNMNTSDFNKGVAAAQSQIRRLNRNVESQNTLLTKSFSSLKNSVTAFAASLTIGAMVSFGKAAMELYDIQIKNETALLTALKGRKEIQQFLIKQAGDLQRITLFGDEETIKAQQILVQFGLASTEISKLIPLIQDFSTAMGVDLKTAAELVGTAINSSRNPLKKYGIDLNNTMTEVEKANVIMSKFTEKFGGQAKSAAEVGISGIEQLKGAWGDLMEIIGSKIGPFFNALSLILKDKMLDEMGNKRTLKITGFNYITGLPIIEFVDPILTDSEKERQEEQKLINSYLEGDNKKKEQIVNNLKQHLSEFENKYKKALEKAGVNSIYELPSLDDRTEEMIFYSSKIEKVKELLKKIDELSKGSKPIIDEGDIKNLTEYEKLSKKIKDTYVIIKDYLVKGSSVPEELLENLRKWQQDLIKIDEQYKLIEERMKGDNLSITTLTPKGINLPSFNNKNLETGSFIGDEFSPPEFNYEFTSYLEELNNVAILTTSIMNTLGDAFINMAETGEFSFKSLVQTTLQGIRQIVMAKLAEAIMGQAAANSKFGLPGLAMTAGAIIGLQAIFASLPKFSTGGIVGGTSYSGDKVPILANSKEMILNQTQQANLFSYLNKDLNNPSSGQVEFIIRGDNLYGVLNKHNKKISTYI